MLNFLRKSVGTWFGAAILALALGALVITMFQPSGPGGVSGANGTVLATVGKQAVTDTEYVATIDRAMMAERESNPEMTTPQFIALGGGDLVLDQLIQGLAINAFGDVHDMPISRRMVDGEIASIPALQVNGIFDEATFRRLLADQRISEQELREGIATDLRRRQILQPIALGVTVPQGLAEPFAKLLLEVRHGHILAIPSAAMPEPGAPTDEQLQTWHKANSRIYTLPERRTFRYVLFDREKFLGKATPAPEEVAEYYKTHAAEFGGVELREVSQIIVRDRAAADKLVASVRGGVGFDEAARTQGWEPGDTRLGRISKDALGKQAAPAVADAAFALAVGAVSNPVETPLGFHIVQTTAVVPPSPRPLATVSADITQRLTEEKVQELLADSVARAEDELADGRSLADVAKDMELQVQLMAPVTADGRQYSDDYQVTRVDQPRLLTQVFASSPEDGAHAVDLGDNRFALFEITDVMRPEPVPLASIRDDVAAAWQNNARSEAAKAMADKIAGGDAMLAEAARANSLPAPQQLSVRRLELTQMAQQDQEVPPPVLMLANSQPGAARVLEAPGGQGWFVVKVDKVEAGDVAQVPQLTSVVRESMRRESADELVGTFLRVLERDAGVVRRPDAIKVVNRRLSGSGTEQP
ncbi:MAG: peptidyl-prolyl cis-trans isomerase [Sphingomonadaceae bacterium]